MSDQLTLTGFEPPEYLETSFLDSVLPSLQSAIADRGGETAHLFYKSTAATSGPSSGYTAVYLHTFTVFRLPQQHLDFEFRQRDNWFFQKQQFLELRRNLPQLEQLHTEAF